MKIQRDQHCLKYLGDYYCAFRIKSKEKDAHEQIKQSEKALVRLVSHNQQLFFVS